MIASRMASGPAQSQQSSKGNWLFPKDNAWDTHQRMEQSSKGNWKGSDMGSWGKGKGKSGGWEHGQKLMEEAYRQGLMDAKGMGKGSGKGKSKGKGGKAKNGGGGKAVQKVSWKAELRHAFAISQDDPITEDDIIYTTVQDDAGFVCSLTLERIHNSYGSEEVCSSQKLAEESAAKMALEGEFPEVFKHASRKMQAQQGVNTLDLTWRSRLNNAFQKHHKVALTKDTLIYTTEQEEGTEEPKCFVSSITSDMFENTHVSEEAQPSKRLAEESAAMVALEAEFPDVYNSIPEEARKLDVAPRRFEGKERIKNDNKGNDTAGRDPKSQLNQGMTILIERSLTRADAVYACERIDRLFTATVTLHCLDVPESFTGEPASEQKVAEASAATVALEAFTDRIEEKRPEWEAMQREKKAARSLKLQEKQGDEPLAKKSRVGP